MLAIVCLVDVVSPPHIGRSIGPSRYTILQYSQWPSRPFSTHLAAPPQGTLRWTPILQWHKPHAWWRLPCHASQPHKTGALMGNRQLVSWRLPIKIHDRGLLTSSPPIHMFLSQLPSSSSPSHSREIHPYGASRRTLPDAQYPLCGVF